MDTLSVEPRHFRYGCGIYEVGENKLRMFITDAGFVIPVTGRVLREEDLMEAYVQGRLEQEKIDKGAAPNQITMDVSDEFDSDDFDYYSEEIGGIR